MLLFRSLPFIMYLVKDKYQLAEYLPVIFITLSLDNLIINTKTKKVAINRPDWG